MWVGMLGGGGELGFCLKLMGSEEMVQFEKARIFITEA